MSTQITKEQQEFAERHSTSGIQTLQARCWQSDPLNPDQIGLVLDSWFKISNEHPYIIVEHWQIYTTKRGRTEAEDLCRLTVQFLCPETWDASKIDRIIL